MFIHRVDTDTTVPCLGSEREREREEEGGVGGEENFKARYSQFICFVVM